MRAQRVRDGESRVEMQIVKWAAEGAVKGTGCRVFCDVRHTSVAGDMLVSHKGTSSFRESGWHRGRSVNPSLTDSKKESVRDFFVIWENFELHIKEDEYVSNIRTGKRNRTVRSISENSGVQRTHGGSFYHDRSDADAESSQQTLLYAGKCGGASAVGQIFVPWI
jgi:hypothetical protein